MLLILVYDFLNKLSILYFFIFFRYTTKGKILYATVLFWPQSNSVVLGAVTPTPQMSITMLGLKSKLKFSKHAAGGIEVQFPLVPYSEVPCKDAWVFKITGSS